MLNRGAFAQRGASALGFDLGAELVLQLFVLTDRQAAPLADLGCSTLRSLSTPIADAGGELGVFAWTIGTVWPPGHVTCPCPKSKVKSSFVKRVPLCGQGRAMM
jgi:hypothetical protein